MFRSLHDLKDLTIKVENKEAGTLHSFLFDDMSWIIRYFVVDVGRWFSGRKVLASPIAIKKVNWQKRTVEVFMTKDQIEKSPEIDADKPVSRQKEEEYVRHYNWPIYWRAPFAPPPTTIPNPLRSGKNKAVNSPPKVTGDSHLRSSEEVIGYRIHAKDGELGHVEDFIAEEEGWYIRYMIIGTGKWFPGRKVILSPEWVDDIRWAERKVYIDLPRDTIRQALTYDPNEPLTELLDEELAEHYERREV